MSSTDLGRHRDRRSSFLGAVRVQGRVINGLLTRELAARFGKRGSGMLFTFLVPGGQVIIIAMLRLLSGFPGYAGMAIFPFTACGLLYFRGWRNMVNDQIDAVPSNLGLLYFRQVTELDIYIGRFLVNLTINMSVAVAIYMIMRIFGFSGPAEEPLYLLLLLILTNFFGFVYGMTLAAFAIFVPVIKSINTLTMRVLLFLSGVFFVVPEIPPGFREYLLWNPLLHITELARSYYFIEYQTAFGDLTYVLKWVGAFLVSGLLMERLFRDRVVR